MKTTMPTKTINGRLEIDVSHPWDRPGPIKQPEPHPDAIPTEDEILELLGYFYENEGVIFPSLITEYDMSDFMMDGKSFLVKEGSDANI